MVGAEDAVQAIEDMTKNHKRLIETWSQHATLIDEIIKREGRYLNELEPQLEELEKQIQETASYIVKLNKLHLRAVKAAFNI